MSDKHLTKEYAVSEAANPARSNGNYGLSSGVDTLNWRMYVIKKNGDTLKIKLDDLKKLPKTEIVFNFKCIEGWSQIHSLGRR